VALVGANGAGKSTLLQLAVGLLTPSAGTVMVFGSRPQENAAVLSAVGFVAQTTPLYDSFTVNELVAFGAKLNPRFEATAARRKLSALGIDARSRAGHLSGGQRAQVALALALAKRPRLLILDEPVASLDPLARREFLQSLMEAVAEEGTTVALSSHLITDLERVCDYLVVLSASRVQVLGDIEELLASHALLTGPASNAFSLALSAPVVAESSTGRQATLLARTNGATLALPGGWTSSTITLDELVLAYMRNPLTGALPGPQLLVSAL
jgi:ABC-2 type transport system ATP-binding protein